MENLHHQYPVRSRRVFQRLQGICDQMCHWSEIFSQTHYLPHMAFPFVLVFGADELSALETVMTLFMYWGYSWHATFPHAPAHIVDSFDGILKHSDARLHRHLKNLNIAPGVLCWGMLSTLFSEICNKEDWLRLMDFMFAHFSRTEFVLLAPVAIMRICRASILAAGHEDHILKFFRSRQGMRIKEVIALIQDMITTVPHKLFSSVLVNESREHNAPSRGDIAEARESLATSKGKAIFPLPRGRYPAYDGFPAHLVDWQLKDRDRALSLNTEIQHREEVLSNLTEKIAKSQADHQVWMLQHEATAATEIAHRAEVLEREKARMKRLTELEEEISKQRMIALSVADKAAEEEMQLMEKVGHDARKAAEMNEGYLKDKTDMVITMQKHREAAEDAERITSERMRSLYSSRAKEEWMQSLSETMRSKEQELEQRFNLKTEQWKREDDVMRTRREARVEAARSEVNKEGYERLQGEMLQKLQRLELEREAKILENERTRAVRLATETADEAVEAAERSEMLLQKQEAVRASENVAALTEKGIHKIQKNLLETVSLIKTEGERLVEAERVHILKRNQTRLNAKNAEIRKEWALKQEEQLKAVLEAETAVQEQVLRLQRATIRAELEEEALQEAGGGRGFDELQRRIENLGEDILRDQRDRFQEIREEAARFEKQLVGGAKTGRNNRLNDNSAVDIGVSSSARKGDLNVSMIPQSGGDQSSLDMEIDTSVFRSTHTEGQLERAINKASAALGVGGGANSNSVEASRAKERVELENMARDTLRALNKSTGKGGLGPTSATKNKRSPAPGTRGAIGVASSPERDGSSMSQQEMSDYLSGDAALWAYHSDST